MICDFGLSKFLDDGGRTNSICGTPHAQAPEVYAQKSDQRDESHGGYDKRIDFWGLGVLLFELIQLGESPFGRSTSIDEFQSLKLMSPESIRFDPARHTVESRDLICKLLVFCLFLRGGGQA
jgi:serine/threonine protein kinase